MQDEWLLGEDLVQLLPLGCGRPPLLLQLLDSGKSLDGRVLGLVMLYAGDLVPLPHFREAPEKGASLGFVGTADNSIHEKLVCHVGANVVGIQTERRWEECWSLE
jgi:hypothetical protein